jgi:cell division protein FtsW
MAKIRGDSMLLLMVLILAIFGLVMIMSIGIPKSMDLTNKANILYPNCSDSNIDCYFLFKRHLIHLMLGGVLFFIMAKIPYRLWKKLSVLGFGATVLLLFLVLILGKSNNTFAKSWLMLGNTSFQPIEFAKLALIFYLATWIERKNTTIMSLRNGFIPFCIVTGFIVLPILLQPDLGGAMVVLFIAAAMVFASGAKIRHLASAAVIGVLAAIIFITSLSPIITRLAHVQARFKAFISADTNCKEKYCWQPEQANIAIGSGGFFGKGLTQGVQKSYWLPQASDDFIFAAASEELGFVRMSLIVLVYAVIAYRGLKIARHAENRFVMLTAVGTTTWITAQAFINIAVNLAMMPVTGITLPLISYGGSSLLSIMMAMGVLSQLSKHSLAYAPSALRRGNRRTYYSERSSYSRA